MAIVVGNGPGDPSSNLGQAVRISHSTNTVRKVMNRRVFCCIAIVISITTVIKIHIQIQADSDTNGFNFWRHEESDTILKNLC